MVIPEHSAPFRRRLRLAVAFALLALAGGEAGAQPERSDEATVKGAYLVSFMKFTRWPADSWPQGNGAVTIGVVGDAAVLQALSAQRTVTVRGRPLRARQVDRLEDATGCQVLFVGRSFAAGVDAWAPDLERAGVMTVSERPEDGRSAVITLVATGDRLAFEVNLEAARRAHLELDSQLLRIARHVHGTPGGSR